VTSKSFTHYFENLKSLLILSFPLMIIQVFNQARGIVDVAMIGHVDEINLAGLSLATSIFTLLFLGIGSFSFAMISVFSELYAKKEFKEIKFYAQQLVYFNIISGALFALFCMNAGFLFSGLDLLPETKQVAAEYLEVMGYSAIFACLGMALQCLMQSFVKNNHLLMITFVSFFLNIPLNYVFIYGVDGVLDPMYAKGCAIATAICFVFDFLAVAIYCAYHKEMTPFSKLHKIDFKEFKTIFKLGYPMALGMMMEVGLFAALAFLVAKYGEATVGANQIALNFTGIVYMFSVGASMAIMQRVSFLRGLDDLDKIKQTVWGAVNISLLLSLVTISVTLAFKEQIIMSYTDSEIMSAIAIKILLISVFYQLFDSMQAIGLGVLRAYKLNAAATKRAFVCYWIIGIIGGDILSRFYGAYGYWIGLIICFMVAAVLYYRKIYQVVWQNAEK